MPDAAALTARNELSREIYIFGDDGVMHRIAHVAFTEPVCGRVEKVESKQRGRTRAVLATNYPDGTGSLTVYKVAPGNPLDVNITALLAGTMPGIAPRNTVGAGTGENRPTVESPLPVYGLRCVYKSMTAAAPTTYREWDLVHFDPAESVSPQDSGDTIELALTVYGADSGELPL